MKYILLGITLISFFSCTHTNDVVNTPPVDSVKVHAPVLDSVKQYITNLKDNHYDIIKYDYDQQGRLVGGYSVSADTSKGGYLYPDTSRMTISYHGTDSLPFLVTYWDFQNSQGSNAYEYNYMSYDEQQRLSIDSLSETHVDHYTYSDGYYTINSPYGVYTLYKDGSNLTRYVFPYEGYEFIFTDLKNPWFIPKLSDHTGRVLAVDFMSEKLFSQRKIISDLSNLTVNYTWTTDSDGRVVSGIGTDQGTGKPLEYYWFIYKK